MSLIGSWETERHSARDLDRALGKMLVRKNAGSTHRTMWWNQGVGKGHRGAIHCVGLGMIAK